MSVPKPKHGVLLVIDVESIKCIVIAVGALVVVLVAFLRFNGGMGNAGKLKW